MTYEEISKILESKDYRFAKTMAEHPHSYTLIDEWENKQEFYNVVQYIRDYGVKEKFYRVTYIYLHINGYKYWTMGAPLSETILINRAKNDN